VVGRYEATGGHAPPARRRLRVYGCPVGRIERQVKNDAEGFIGAAVKLCLLLVAVAWPIALIDGTAFGPYPNWWQWTPGGLPLS
jgi:hypothetical protein